MSLPFPADKKRIIKTIVGLFETGRTTADYGAVTKLDDGAGLTYGAHQSTDGGESSLDKIARLYISKGGRLGPQLEPYLERLAADATTREGNIGATPEDVGGWVGELMAILERAGDEDPLMAEAQEEVFESHYWRPAAEQAEAMGLVTPLAWLVCYDSTIHSGSKGIGRIRAKFPEGPPANGGDEREWVIAYLDARLAWLAGHSRAAVRATTYRIDSLLRLAADGQWGLDAPVPIQKPRAEVS